MLENFGLRLGWKGLKYTKKVSYTSTHSHIYSINMKKSIQNFFNFHNKTMVLFIEFIVNYT
jgi:hypothetical protein